MHATVRFATTTGSDRPAREAHRRVGRRRCRCAARGARAVCAAAAVPDGGGGVGRAEHADDPRRLPARAGPLARGARCAPHGGVREALLSRAFSEGFFSRAFHAICAACRAAPLFDATAWRRGAAATVGAHASNGSRTHIPSACTLVSARVQRECRSGRTRAEGSRMGHTHSGAQHSTAQHSTAGGVAHGEGSAAVAGALPRAACDGRLERLCAADHPLGRDREARPRTGTAGPNCSAPAPPCTTPALRFHAGRAASVAGRPSHRVQGGNMAMAHIAADASAFDFSLRRFEEALRPQALVQRLQAALEAEPEVRAAASRRWCVAFCGRVRECRSLAVWGTGRGGLGWESVVGRGMRSPSGSDVRDRRARMGRTGVARVRQVVVHYSDDEDSLVVLMAQRVPVERQCAAPAESDAARHCLRALQCSAACTALRRAQVLQLVAVYGACVPRLCAVVRPPPTAAACRPNCREFSAAAAFFGRVHGAVSL